MSRLKVFLDTSVLLAYFLGEPAAQKFFAPEIIKRVQYIITPLVLQELLLAFEKLGEKENAEEISKLLSKYLTIKPLDIDSVRSREQISQLGNRITRAVHANDLLNIQVAETTADYFLTQDKVLLGFKEVGSVEIISPEQFFNLVKEAA